MSNSFKFTRTVTSVVTTVGLVASAMTGLLYSTPVSATGTQAAVLSPANASTFNTGVPQTFQFSVTNNSSANSTVYAAIGLVGSTFVDAKPTMVKPDTTCNIAVSGGFNTSSTNCDTLFNGTGWNISNVPSNTTVTVTVDKIVSVALPASQSDELKFNIFSSTTANNLIAGTPNTATATYNSRYARSLTINKEKVTDSTKFAAPLAFAQIVAPYTDTIFAIALDNDSQTPYNGVEVRDFLDSTAQGLFDGCFVSQAEVVRSASAGITVGSLQGTSAAATEDYTLTPLAVGGSNSSNSGRTVFYVGCDRNNSTVSEGSVSYNTAEVTRFTGQNDSPYTLPGDLTAKAAITGSGNVKIEKSLVSKSNSTIGSNTDVTYKIKVSNTSSKDADNFLITDVLQVPAGVKVETGSAPVGGDLTNPFQSGSTSVRVVDTGNGLLGLSAAYPANIGGAGTLGNSARVFQVTKLKAGDFFQFNYTVKYVGTFPSTCDVDASAPIIRNSALLNRTGSVNNGDVVSGTVNDITVNAVPSFLKYDFNNSTSNATISNQVMFNDSTSSDNLSFIDNTNDVCEPDMQILDVKKSGPDEITNQAVLGEKTVYTIRYRNYAAKNSTGNIRSSAKGLVATLTLPEGAAFDSFVSPAGLSSSISDRTVTVTGLADLGLGDDTTKELKVVVMQAKEAAKAGTNALFVARINANKEISGYNIDQREKSNTLLSNGSTDQGAPTITSSVNSRGNNAAQREFILKGGPDVQVMKSVDLGEGQLKMDSSMLTYTVKVKNTGTETANSVMVRDTLPTCTTFDSKVSGPDGTLTADGRNIDYNAGNLNVNQELVMVFKVKINQNDACKINNSTVIQNSATATISSSQKDLNITNNTGIANSSVVALNQNAALTKTVDQLVAQPGATLNYTITLKGQGSTFKGTLMDELPAGVTFVSADPAAVRDGNKLTWSNLSVETAKPLTATVKVTVNGDATGTVVNKVTATTTDGKLNFAQAVTSIEVAGNAKVTGYIYFDANKNKKEDKLERGATYADYLGNIRVVAMSSNGKEFSAITNKEGAFTIDKLPAGKYSVKVDINTVKGSYKNIAINVAATDPSADGITRIADVRSNESLDLAAGFRLFTNQTSTGATSSNGFASVTAMVAMLSFSFLATFAYAQARKRALSL